MSVSLSLIEQHLHHSHGVQDDNCGSEECPYSTNYDGTELDRLTDLLSVHVVLHGKDPHVSIDFRSVNTNPLEDHAHV